MKDKSKENQTQNNSKINDLDQTLNLLFEDPQNSNPVGSSRTTEKKEEWLEKLRRSVPLKIDATGQWWHAGEAFRHQRLIHLFNRGLDMNGEESIVRIGDRWCYIDCEITPFLILKIQVHTDSQSTLPTLYAYLNNTETLPLCHLSIRDDILFAQLAPQRYARFSQHAQSQCMTWLIQDEVTQAYALKHHHQILPIASDD